MTMYMAIVRNIWIILNNEIFCVVWWYSLGGRSVNMAIAKYELFNDVVNVTPEDIFNEGVFQDPMLLQIYIDFWIDDTRIAREHQFNLDHNCSWSKKEKAAKKYGIHLLWHHTTMPLIHIMNLDIYCRHRSGALIGFFEVGFTLRLNKLMIFFPLLLL